jgi:hypothetical protein
VAEYPRVFGHAGFFARADGRRPLHAAGIHPMSLLQSTEDTLHQDPDALAIPDSNIGGPPVASCDPPATPLQLEPTKAFLFLERRRERDQCTGQTVFTSFDISYPDGRPVSVGFHSFCQHGTRLLLGRACHIERAMIGITLYPVAGLEADLTRPGPGVRCRRFYALRSAEEIRLHFFNGTPTEIVFHAKLDDATVLHWLRADYIRPNTPFWFDLASKLEVDHPALTESK